MTVQWGLVSRDELTMFEPGDPVEDFPHVAALRPGEVAVGASEAILYGSPDQMIAMARQVLARWDTVAERQAPVAITVAGATFTTDELTTLIVSAGEVREGVDESDLSGPQIDVLDKAHLAYRRTTQP